jgi:hypothetical protein
MEGSSNMSKVITFVSENCTVEDTGDLEYFFVATESSHVLIGDFSFTDE